MVFSVKLNKISTTSNWTKKHRRQKVWMDWDKFTSFDYNESMFSNGIEFDLNWNICVSKYLWYFMVSVINQHLFTCSLKHTNLNINQHHFFLIDLERMMYIAECVFYFYFFVSSLTFRLCRLLIINMFWWIKVEYLSMEKEELRHLIAKTPMWHKYWHWNVQLKFTYFML